MASYTDVRRVSSRRIAWRAKNMSVTTWFCGFAPTCSCGVRERGKSKRECWKEGCICMGGYIIHYAGLCDQAKKCLWQLDSVGSLLLVPVVWERGGRVKENPGKKVASVWEATLYIMQDCVTRQKNVCDNLILWVHSYLFLWCEKEGEE